MLKHLLNIFIYLFTFISVTACGDSGDNPDEPEIPKVHRTVLVYMIADSNLGSKYHFDKADLDEMLTGVKSGGLNGGRLLVYYNRPGTDDGEAPQLLEVTPEGIIELKLYPDDSSIYSVSTKRMREAIADTKKLAPADDYGIVFWGHATAWMTHNNDISRNAAPQKRSYGADRNKWMSLSALSDALSGESFGFVYFDCCVMGSVEVAYELRHITPYIIASPTELQGYGMPYDLNIPSFFASGKADILTAAKNTFEHSKTRPSYTCQMTVIDTSALDHLAEVSRKIFLTQSTFPQELKTVQQLSKLFTDQTPYCRPVYDMEHHMEILAADSPDLLAEWKQALAETVIYKATTDREYNGIVVKRYCGLGSYVVMAPGEENYRGYSSCSWWTDVVSKAPVFN